METTRPIRESELEELLDLLCLVHNPKGRERYRGYIEGDPTWLTSQTPVVVVDGRIVSTLRIWDRRVHVGATPFRMGGIGGVTTHPDYRKRGIATRLMAYAAEYMRDDGYDLGLLFSAIPARFYLRLGWCCVPLTGFLAELRSPPKRERSALEVLPFVETRDLEETAALYQRHNAGRSGSMLRPRPLLGLRSLPRAGRAARDRRPQPGWSVWIHQLGSERRTESRCPRLHTTTARPWMLLCSACLTRVRMPV